MDTMGCPPGFATDMVMLTSQASLACDMSVSVYVVIGTILMITKIFIAIQHSHAWLLRLRTLKKRSARHARRIPFVPMLSWLLAFFYIPFFALTFANVATVHNGAPAALFGLGWLCIGLLCMFYLFKFVSLGYRIIPHRMRMGSKISDDDGEEDSTSKFDFAGKFSVVFCFIALFGQTICFVVLAPIFPYDNHVLRIGFGFQGWFILQHFASITHHFSRVKDTIRKSYNASRDLVAPGASKELKLVLGKIREQQFILGVVEFLCISFTFILAGGAVKIAWYVPVIFMSFESLNFTLIAISDMKGKRTAKRLKTPANNRKAGGEGSVNQFGGDLTLGNLYITTVGGDLENVSSVNPDHTPFSSKLSS